MMKTVGVLLVILFALTACTATPLKVPLITALPSNEIKVYSLIPQKEIEVLVPIVDNSAVYVQFGLVGAIVGGAMDANTNMTNTEKANNILLPLKNELVGLNFDKLFENEIIKKLHHQPKMKLKFAGTVKSYKEINQKVATGETYLVLQTSYKLDQDFRTPFIVTNVSINKRAKKQKNTYTYYKNTFTYFGRSLPKVQKSSTDIATQILKVKADYANKNKKTRYYKTAIRKANQKNFSEDEQKVQIVSTWNSKYKNQLKEDISYGIQDLFSIISNDLRDSESPETYRNKGITPEGYPTSHKSIVITENLKRKVIRFTKGSRNGSICSMPTELSTEKRVCI